MSAPTGPARDGMIGASLKHYKIVERIAEGGMGVVYRAHDTHLDRTVAVKVLRPEAVEDAERKWRFVREAKAASALNHPHIVTIHDIDSDAGVDFMVMEYVDGSSLDRLIPPSGLPVDQVLDYGEQMASALGAAHAAGIVHRDIKPANVMVGPGGRVKVLDFGLAKLVEPEQTPSGAAATRDSTATAATVEARTRQGAILGTIAYMSPEQAQGKPVDARSDVFSLGSVLYEMLAGRRPFQGDSHLLTLTAILRDAAPPLKSVRADVPAEVQRIVTRSLEKRPADRYASASEMAADIARLRGGPAREHSDRPPLYRRASFMAPLAAALVVAAAAIFWLVRESRIRRARSVMLPEISRLTEQQKPAAAVRLSREAERYLPAEVAKLRRETWLPATIETDPPGAQVSMRDYLSSEADWQPFGTTPVRGARLPMGYYRWKISKPGYQPAEAAGAMDVDRRLDLASAVPPGMVHVAGGPFSLRSLPAVRLDDFWIDMYEVTNAQYKAFVDSGGYARREYWKQPFTADGRELSWESAMEKFRDTTGRPGPATWELGAFPEGHGNYPVEGVSWYEAAAYAEYAGKSLPTVYHWYRAAGIGAMTENFSDILRVANFGGKGAAPVGSRPAMSPFGSYDMAGNVKEWCLNDTTGRRYLLGGAWTDANYMFREADAQDAFIRLPGFGFRCVRYMKPVVGALTETIPVLARDYTKEKPVSDDVFRVYRSFFSYDRTPLDVRNEGPEESSPYWRRLKVSYAAAYGNERVPAYLFLPKNARPPYQTVVYFPSSYARIIRSSAEMDIRFLEFVIRSGRAAMYPIYQDTYERHIDSPPAGPNFRRDLVIQWSKDLGRTLDYLETRPDIDRGRFAYYGMSLGAIDGVVLVALENRFRTAILSSGGFRLDRVPPEVEPINFAPRIRIPVLLIAGRYDFAHPFETTQLPLFRLLGTPAQDKKHVSFEGGHIAVAIQPIVREMLDWLDRYLGPVAPPR
jgi:eukaryotic-like serine/threonine-protein kinase